ncbi:hypothetical protein Rhal01_02568 [Rubritalea halochordaticola]|uniref:DUF4252 domain-containing protein n=1 Tax=Rubritalea halochordaticola TaxID=714537 RepID=A0ABP9V311_9BACT
MKKTTLSLLLLSLIPFMETAAADQIQIEKALRHEITLSESKEVKKLYQLLLKAEHAGIYSVDHERGFVLKESFIGKQLTGEEYLEIGQGMGEVAKKTKVKSQFFIILMGQERKMVFRPSGDNSIILLGGDKIQSIPLSKIRKIFGK